MNSKSIKFRCPKCHKTISTSRESVGVDGICPACGEHVQVPKQSRLFGLNLLTVSLLTGTLILFAGGAAFVYRSHSAYLERKTRMRVSDAAMLKTGAVPSPPARTDQEQPTGPPEAPGLAHQSSQIHQQPATKPSEAPPPPLAEPQISYTFGDAIAALEKRIPNAEDADVRDGLRSVRNEKKDLEKLLAHIKRIKSGGSLNRTAEGTQYGDTALKLASLYCYPDLVELLLAKGAKVDPRDSWANTPLMYASEMGHVKIVKLLLRKGAKANWAVFAEGVATGGSFSNFIANPLSLASEGGHLEIAKLLIERGADVNADALRGAAGGGQVEIAKFLIEKGVNVNAKNKNGETALMAAAENGQTEISRFLLASGADVNARDKFGLTALIEAARSGKMPTLELLIETGSDVNSKNRTGESALMFAAYSGHTEAVRKLIEKGADINAKSQDGNTALSLASDAQKTDVVTLLKSHGAK